MPDASELRDLDWCIVPVPKGGGFLGLSLIPASSFEKKPGAAPSFVDPGLKQTGGCNILVLIA